MYFFRTGVVDLQVEEVAVRRSANMPATRLKGLAHCLDNYLPEMDKTASALKVPPTFSSHRSLHSTPPQNDLNVPLYQHRD